MGRGESLLKEMLDLPGLDSLSIIQDAGEAGSQDVPMKAAIYVALGNVEAMYKRNLKSAMGYINKSLDI